MIPYDKDKKKKKKRTKKHYEGRVFDKILQKSQISNINFLRCFDH